MTKRYGRAQFLQDAIGLGLTRESAFSRAALRHRRDRLILIHHPDRGGDADKAAHVNAVYARMLKWLDGRDARANEERARREADAARPAAGRFSRAAAGAWGMALAAVATYAVVVRGRRGP